MDVQLSSFDWLIKGPIPPEIILKLNPHHPLVSAIRKTSLWLHYLGVKTEIPQNNNHFDLIVKDVRFRVSFHEGEFKDSDPILLNQNKINSKDDNEFLQEFHRLTKTIGLGTPQLLRRAEKPKHKVKSSDSFESVALRHVEFIRAPNPEPEHLEMYSKVVKIASQSFLRKNKGICGKFGYHLQDLITFAQVWTVSWIAHTELPIALGRQEENPVLLMANLKKRFLDLFNLMKRKERLIDPDYQTVVLSMGGTLFNLNEIETPKIEEEEIEINEARRRRLAAKGLSKNLAELPHDKLLLTLETYSSSLHAHPDAAKEALKRLKKHKANCGLCSGQIDKKVTGINPLSSSI